MIWQQTLMENSLFFNTFFQRGQWITAVKYHFRVFCVMDYRLLISDARLKAVPSVRLPAESCLQVYFFQAERRRETASAARLVTSSHLPRHPAPLPADCQPLWQLLTLTEAQPKGGNSKQKRLQFGSFQRFSEVADNLIDLDWMGLVKQRGYRRVH